MVLTSKGPAIEDSKVADVFGSYYFYKIDEEQNDVYRSPKGHYLFIDSGKWVVGIYFWVKV